MPVIIIDGPEKAGKTTVIAELIKWFEGLNVQAERIHWGKMDTDDRVYAPVLQQHASDTSGKVWIWDRGWPSEFVYGRLLNRDRRMAFDPWIGEWLHGRAVQANGLRVILAGPNPSQLKALRDSSDLDVSPDHEQALFMEYGHRFGWEVIQNEHTAEGLHKVTEHIANKLIDNIRMHSAYIPPKWSGPNYAKVVVVGQPFVGELLAGGWLPFASEYTTLWAREFGDDAFKVAWLDCENSDIATLHHLETIITLGDDAASWVRAASFLAGLGKGGYRIANKVINLDTPELVFGYNTDKAARRLELLRQVIRSLKPL